MATDIGVDPGRVASVVAELRQRGLVAGEDGAAHLTPEGAQLAQRAVEARRELLCEALADEQAERDPAVDALLRRLARELAGEPPVSAAA
jgi:DNA-binding MarR family transcriptional regulator